jgi:TolB-like protein/class 3 adenylate cyclase/Tfp pilus assembly protein PilF
MSQDVKLEHRLAAIMATDVVGYSQSMQADEAETLAALSAIREATEDQISRHRGRIANTAGDSVLAEFASAVDAVRCAIALQEALAKQSLQVRIGIHIGDVIDKDGDLFGTAVNVAARLEGIAPSGGTVVSAAVHDDVIGKLATNFSDLGQMLLKNIAQQIRVYRLSQTTASAPTGAPREDQALPLPNKPSIAVLPFENLSGDREQEYFADGVVEEIITALSRFRGLFVIARNSSFAYKGRPIDVKQVGRELGVRYLLEGSIRKAGSRVRIAGQLIETATGAHLWADRFDGALEDIFDLQDQVTASVGGAIAPKLEQAEIERSRRKPTENLDAYDYYLRGLAGLHQWTKQGIDEAKSNLYHAIELDPNFAVAYGMAARCFVMRKGSGWVTNRDDESAEATRLARRAVELGKDDAVALGTAGLALFYIAAEYDDAKVLTDRALTLNPNLASAWMWSGWVRVCIGEPEAAVDRVGRALRLSPSDPHSGIMFSAMAFAHFLAGRFKEAVSWAEMAVLEKPTYLLAVGIAAACYALAGRAGDANKAITRARQLDPTLRLSTIHNLFPLRRPELWPSTLLAMPR